MVGDVTRVTYHSTSLLAATRSLMWRVARPVIRGGHSL